VHYGPEFLCSLLNEQPMGFYPPDNLVHDAQRRRIQVVEPDVLDSDVECSVQAASSKQQAGLAVRIGLGYVNGVRKEDVEGIVAERERGGAFSSAADLAARCSAHSESLEKLAWAGACDSLAGSRRRALWLLGVAVPGVRVKGGTQLALPFDGHAPELRDLTPWERMLADYRSIRITLREHPLELMRPELPADLLTSAQLEHAGNGRRVRTAGMVVARQRPATAKGVTFMLLEDEHGTINLIVPPPVHERFRLAVRSEPLVLAEGKLEHREGVTNILVSKIERLDRPDLPMAEVKHIEPRRIWSSEAGDGVPEEVADLRAVAPVGHSFGRRGR
jgi:error-prone DNA polymerase